MNSILELVKMKMKSGYKRSGLTIDQNERNWVSGWVGNPLRMPELILDKDRGSHSWLACCFSYPPMEVCRGQNEIPEWAFPPYMFIVV